MIIDFHTHVFPDKIAQSTVDALALKSNGTPSTNGSVNGLLDAIGRANIDLAVTLPVMTKPTQFDSITRFACEINQNPSNNKILSFGGIHPDCEDIDGKLSLLKELGIKGVKIHSDYQNTYINSYKYLEILQCAKKYDFVIISSFALLVKAAARLASCAPLVFWMLCHLECPDISISSLQKISELF